MNPREAIAQAKSRDAARARSVSTLPGRLGVLAVVAVMVALAVVGLFRDRPAVRPAEPPAVAAARPAPQAPTTADRPGVAVERSAPPPPAPKPPAWRPLFDGASLAGWNAEGPVPDPDAWWRSGDGVLRGTSVGRRVRNWVGEGSSWLRTSERFDDFDLSLQWRFVPDGFRGNNGSGVVVACTGPLNGSGLDPVGVEIDLPPPGLSDTPDGPLATGSLRAYDTPLGRKPRSAQEANVRLAPFARTALRPAGSFNDLTVRCVGGLLEVRHNGEVVNRARTTPRAGHICLRNQNSDVEFRAIRIRAVAAPVDPSP